MLQSLSYIDYIILFILILGLIRGWCKGAVRTLIGPLSLVIATAVSILYFQQTRNLLISLYIGIAGPLVINILFYFLISFWNKSIDQKKYLSVLSRGLGALLCLTWNLVLIILTLLFAALLPSLSPALGPFTRPVTSSQTFKYLNPFLLKKFSTESLSTTISSLQNPQSAEFEKMKKTPEYTALMEDEKIQKILANEELVTQIQNKNFGKLLSNPEITAIYADKEVMQKIFNFAQKAYGKKFQKREEGPLTK